MNEQNQKVVEEAVQERDAEIKVLKLRNQGLEREVAHLKALIAFEAANKLDPDHIY
jgi:cell division protein FtsB